MEGVLEEIIMTRRIRLSTFSHVMNDDMIGTTFIYFDSGTVQDLDKGNEQEYGEHCIWLDEQDHKKLEAALRQEPYECTVFTKKEMNVIKRFLTPERGVNGFNLKAAALENEMNDEEWKTFLEKIG